jgi:serine/alanine adding enzyme
VAEYLTIWKEYEETAKQLGPYMSLKVELCRDPAAWDAYVREAPGASNCHLWRWKQVIEQTYGHYTYYLMGTRGAEVQGVLPLARMKSRIFGHFLVSLPFVNYGGVLASTEDAWQALLEKATELARELDVQHVELRQGTTLGGNWKETTAKVAMVVQLPKTADELWGSLSSRLRNKVRNAQKHGIIARWGGTELVGSFYSVFAVNMRDLGTPVYPRSWFENVYRAAHEDSKILTLWKNSQPVAATMVTTFRDGVELPWIASIPQERKSYSTVLLYWTALEWAVRNGYLRVDLGRCTPGGGVYQFKKQWNCTENLLHWYYWLAPGVPLPHLRPDNPRYRLAVRLWRHFPLTLTNWLGPRIVRSIP